MEKRLQIKSNPKHLKLVCINANHDKIALTLGAIYRPLRVVSKWFTLVDDNGAVHTMSTMTAGEWFEVG